MTSTGKKNNDIVLSINDKLTKLNKPIKWKNGITLSAPVLFKQDEQEWHKDLEKLKTKGDVRWETLIQQGPYFTHLMVPYEPLGIYLTYEGKKYALTPKEEEIAVFYARRLISEASGGVVDEWTKDKVFNNNFWQGFRTYLTPEHRAIFKNFSKIGWTDAVAKVEAKKEAGLTKEEITEKKIVNEEKKHKYGYAILDGRREKVGNFTVEPASIFYGRGANPNRGKVKHEIMPEDVTINATKPYPEPPPGHKWGSVVSDKNGIWLAKWKDSITGDTKYVQFAAEGRFKGESDLGKYENARKLQRHIVEVRDRYMVDACSNSIVKKQLGTVLWLIDNYGVRVGGEKGTDEADTVGATTLRVEHVKLESPDSIIFDFLGKDSIRFYKKLSHVPKVIYNNFKSLLSNKKKTDQVFDDISSRSVNLYLKEFDKNFTAKVFRTRLASSIMFEALKDHKISPGLTNAQIKVHFNKANVKVADVLNHTRNISKKAKESIVKDQEKLKDLKDELKQKTKEGKATTAIEKRIETTKTRIESKTDVMAVAINTSLTNYIDPRLVVAWCKTEKVPEEAIYSKALLTKFQWAIDMTPPTWNWMTSPLMGNKELEPSEDHDIAFASSEEERKKKKQPAKPKEKHTVPKPKEGTKVIPQKPSVVVPQKPKNNLYEKDFDILLQICKFPKTYVKKLASINKIVLDWVYPLAQYAVSKNINVPVNRLFVDFYEKAYLKK
jgi:DNA topoisomerase-1